MHKDILVRGLEICVVYFIAQRYYWDILGKTVIPTERLCFGCVTQTRTKV
jgi:hypothetical protein